jgi:hypothetical protein
MIIIGFSAKKQGGKSTLVDYLKSNLPCSEVIRFADCLKQIVLDCFVPSDWNLKTPDDLDTEEIKNKVLPCMRSVRNVLQTVGTDMFRNQIWQDCWINAYKKAVRKSKAAFVLTPDVRFPNELKTIQEMGGKVIRLLRAPLIDDHESETALDGVKEQNLIKAVLAGYYLEDLDNVYSTIMFTPKYPGECFDVIYDNRNKTLCDAKVWADRFLKKCFSWDGITENSGVANSRFDLMGWCGD